MAIRKQAFMYSFLAILMILIIVITTANLNKSSMREKTYAISQTIKSMDNHFTGVQDDITRGVNIVGIRSIIAISDIIASKGTYINNLNNVFKELFFNGTYENNIVAIMNQTSFNQFTNALEQNLLTENIILNITPQGLELYQTDPWHITVSVNLSIQLKDSLNTAKWDDEYQISKAISILDFDDPLYTVKSNGFVRNQIYPTNYTSFASLNNVHNLSAHLNNSFYITSNTAPNYLMRLQGNYSPNANGIESLVNLQKFIDQGLPIDNRSVVDYLYFSGKPITNMSKIQFMPDWFVLDRDDNHTNIYQVEHLT